MTGFCRMNKAEPICRSLRDKISCFKNGIPLQFESTGEIDIDCSFIFPPGYSIYVEEFIFLKDDPGPDNFILLNDERLQYHSELKWEFRRQNFWDTLEKGHPLRERSIRRANYQCVDTLKVKIKKFILILLIQNNIDEKIFIIINVYCVSFWRVLKNFAIFQNFLEKSFEAAKNSLIFCDKSDCVL